MPSKSHILLNNFHVEVRTYKSGMSKGREIARLYWTSRKKDNIETIINELSNIGIHTVIFIKADGYYGTQIRGNAKICYILNILKWKGNSPKQDIKIDYIHRMLYKQALFGSKNGNYIHTMPTSLYVAKVKKDKKIKS